MGARRNALAIGGQMPVAIIGAGFGGLSMAKRLEDRGIEYVIFERSDELGGTWRDNTYPGCKCDVQSALYSFSFDLNPNWSHTFPEQQEIFAYMKAAAVKIGALDRIRFGDPLRSASWDSTSGMWDLVTESGRYSAGSLVLAVGPLSEPRLPEVQGSNRFDGTIFHSARWDHEVDLVGRKVAVVGSGASAIQFVPRIQPLVSELYLLQRTPPWILPHLDRPLKAWERTALKYFPPLRSIMRLYYYLQRELLVLAFIKDPARMSAAKKMALSHLTSQVSDPELVRQLTPEYEPGCKRLLLSNDYYPSIQQSNVQLIPHALTGFTDRGVVYQDDKGSELEIDVDTVIFATGFKVTDHPVFSTIVGRTGKSLSQYWAKTGMVAYCGTTVPEFPNLFILAGPNTGIGHTSLVTMIEGQVRYVAGALDLMLENGGVPLEVRQDVFEAYNAEVQQKMKSTVWTTGGCGSWYLDSEGRNTTLWPDFTFRFLKRTRRFDAESYRVVPRSGKHLQGVKIGQ